jgi:hypothetical protein
VSSVHPSLCILLGIAIGDICDFPLDRAFTILLNATIPGSRCQPGFDRRDASTVSKHDKGYRRSELKVVQI